MGWLVIMASISIATEAIMARCSTKIDDLSKPARQRSFYDIWSKSSKTTYEGVDFQTRITEKLILLQIFSSIFRTSAKHFFVEHLLIVASSVTKNGEKLFLCCELFNDN